MFGLAWENIMQGNPDAAFGDIITHSDMVA